MKRSQRPEKPPAVDRVGGAPRPYALMSYGHTRRLMRNEARYLQQVRQSEGRRAQ